MTRFLSFLKRNRLWLFLLLLIFAGLVGQSAVKEVIRPSYGAGLIDWLNRQGP